jgi:hypothetical protein
MPRPAEAPLAEGKPAETEKPVTDKSTAEQPPPPSACRLALSDAIAVAPSIPAINGPGACGGDDLVRLEAVLLPDKGRVALKPAAILRCTMASAIADWIRTDMSPLASSLGTTVSELDNLDSFECRGRNRVVGAKMSEHGRANALDVRSLKLANGQSIALTDRSVARDLREKVLGSVCARFTTVLGPGSDGYHEDHIHLDLAERHNGYRICQWNVYDAMPAVAPLLPAGRPEDAPPRDTVAAKPADKPEPAVAPPAPPPVASPPVASTSPSKEAPIANGAAENVKRDSPRKPERSGPLGQPEAKVVAPMLPRARPGTSRSDTARPDTSRSGTSRRATSEAAPQATAPAKPLQKKKRRRQQPSIFPPELRRLFN